MAITWTQDLSVGIAEIDEQHRRLITLVDDYYQALQAGQSWSVLGPLVEALMAYAREHFHTEEFWMDVYGYPELPSHRREHEDFALRVEGLQQALAEGQLGVGIQVGVFLSQWVRDHVVGADQEYARYFAARGVTRAATSV